MRARSASPRELADADAKKAEAQEERDEFQRKNDEFDQQRAALLSKATDDGRSERQRLLDEARKAADELTRQAAGGADDRSRNLNARSVGADPARRCSRSRARRWPILRRRAWKSAWRGVHRAACARWTVPDESRRWPMHQDGVRTGARAQRVRAARRAACRDRRCAQRDLLGGRPRSASRPRRTCRRHRAHRRTGKSRVEHRGLSRVAGEEASSELAEATQSQVCEAPAATAVQREPDPSTDREHRLRACRSVFDRAFAGIDAGARGASRRSWRRARSARSPTSPPASPGSPACPAWASRSCSSFPAACSASHSTSTRTRSASCCSATTGICTRATRSSARAMSWTCRSATA